MRTWLRRAAAETRYAAVESRQPRGAADKWAHAMSQLSLYYQLDSTVLPPIAATVCAPLQADDETRYFLETCKTSILSSALGNVLRCCLSVTDVNGLLGRGQMFVLSRAHAAELLGASLAAARVARAGEPLRLLDVGAGDGGVTSRLAPLFDEVTTTEVSSWMAWRLRRMGYATVETPFLTAERFPAAGAFDVVSLMNLLDRCDHPADMLRDAVRLLRPGTGVLLVAIVLPFSEFVEAGTRRRAVIQPLPMRGARCGDGASFEASLAALVTRVLVPMGLELLRIASVPYLCRGDAEHPYYTLRDAILVLRPSPDDLERRTAVEPAYKTAAASTEDVRRAAARPALAPL